MQGKSRDGNWDGQPQCRQGGMTASGCRRAGGRKNDTKKTAMQKTLAGGQDYDGDGDGGGGDSGRPSYDTMLERSGGCEYHSRLYLYGILVYISMCTA